jgi:sRNA-binding regulator protein Hfq
MATDQQKRTVLASRVSLMERKLEFYRVYEIDVSIFLTNGVCLSGKILEHDHSAVVITSPHGAEGVTLSRSVVATVMRRQESGHTGKEDRSRNKQQ